VNHRDYDPQGPCGPTAFWKISDREPKTADKQFLLHDFLPIGEFPLLFFGFMSCKRREAAGIC